MQATLIPQWPEPTLFGEKGKEYGLLHPLVISMETYAHMIFEIMLKGTFVQNHAKLL